MGFAMNAANSGEKVSVASQMNCKDGIDDAIKISIAQNILTDLIYPEIQTRVKIVKLMQDTNRIKFIY